MVTGHIYFLQWYALSPFYQAGIQPKPDIRLKQKKWLLRMLLH
jgi:hypothetical protein